MLSDALSWVVSIKIFHVVVSFKASTGGGIGSAEQGFEIRQAPTAIFSLQAGVTTNGVSVDLVALLR